MTQLIDYLDVVGPIEVSEEDRAAMSKAVEEFCKICDEWRENGGELYMYDADTHKLKGV